MRSSKRPTRKRATETLAALAQRINAGLDTERKLGVQRAALIQQIGRWLIQAQRVVGHGNRKTTGTLTVTDHRGWAPWVKASLKCDPDSAGLYMLVYRELGERNPECIRFLPPTLNMQVALARLAKKRGNFMPVPLMPELEPERVRQKLAEPSGAAIIKAAIANGNIHPDMSWDDIRRLAAPMPSSKRPASASWEQAKEERTLSNTLRQAVLRAAEDAIARCPGDVAWIEDVLRKSGGVTDAVADELRERQEKRQLLTPASVDHLTRLYQGYEKLPGIALYVSEARALKRVLDGKIAGWHELELLDETLDAQTDEEASSR